MFDHFVDYIEGKNTAQPHFVCELLPTVIFVHFQIVNQIVVNKSIL